MALLPLVNTGMGSKKPLSIVLISTDYPPLCTSMAVQMRDLAREFALQGHNPIVIIPSEKLEDSWITETQDGVIVLRLKSLKLRHATYYKRTIAEFSLPFIMLYRLLQSPFRGMSIDLVAWYSPTIFFGPLVWYIKHTKKCKSYLILRDIFPEWAVDLGLIKKGLVFWFFKKVTNFQYLMADTIGVQTASNLVYMSKWVKSKSHNVEVLQNWQSPTQDIGSAIQIERTVLSGKKIFVYIGNMGIAQGMDIFIDLADQFKKGTILVFYL